MGEGRLDTTSGVVPDPHPRLEGTRQPRGRAAEVEFDHFGRARADEKQKLDLRAAGEQLRHDAVELLVRVRKTRQVTLINDRRAKPGLGKDHHAGRRLNQVRTGPRPHHEKKGVLYFAVQPDDTGEPAEHLTLTPLAANQGDLGRPLGAACVQYGAHVGTPNTGAVAPEYSLRCTRRAARSLRMNCVALTR